MSNEEKIVKYPAASNPQEPHKLQVSLGFCSFALGPCVKSNSKILIILVHTAHIVHIPK